MNSTIEAPLLIVRGGGGHDYFPLPPFPYPFPFPPLPYPFPRPPIGPIRPL